MLDAALLLFSEKGYHNVSMQEIATEAEFAVGTIYKFFKNKADLYKSLILEQIDAFEEEFGRVVHSQADEEEKLRNFVRIKSERFRGNIPFVRLFISENRGMSFTIKAGFDGALRGRYHDLLEKLSLIFDSGIKTGKFRPIASPFEMAVALDSTVNAFLLLWFEAPETHPFPEDPDAILNIFFKGLIGS
jgi:AcrR family transcriptional regulator